MLTQFLVDAGAVVVLALILLWALWQDQGHDAEGQSNLTRWWLP